LAYPVAASWQTENIARRLDQCRLRSRKAIEDDSEVYAVAAGRNLEERPNVDALDLPYIWAELARRHSCARYFALAAEAAEVINDQGLAAWAKLLRTDSGQGINRRTGLDPRTDDGRTEVPPHRQGAASGFLLWGVVHFRLWPHFVRRWRYQWHG
jgi:hypothetical protein